MVKSSKRVWNKIHWIPNCVGGQIPVLDPSQVWSCGTDSDTTLTEQEVLNIVQSSTSLTLALSSSSTVDGVALLTEKLNIGLEQLTNKPDGLDDGDNDTDPLDALGCSVGQIAIKGEGFGWECKEFSSVLDGDGDGSLQWNDCDDNDDTVKDQSNDSDCDGVETATDCDDNDASNLNSNIGIPIVMV